MGHTLSVPQGAGGIIGSIFRLNLYPKFSVFGSALILIAAFMIGVTLVSGMSWRKALKYSAIYLYIFSKKLFSACKKSFKTDPKKRAKAKVSMPLMEKPQVSAKLKIKKSSAQTSWFKKLFKILISNKLKKSNDFNVKSSLNNIDRLNKSIFSSNGTKDVSKSSMLDMSFDDLLNSKGSLKNTKNIKGASVDLKSNTSAMNKAPASKAKIFKTMPKYDLLYKAEGVQEQMSESLLQEMASLLEQS